MKLKYGFGYSPLGGCCIAFTSEGIYALSFTESIEDGLGSFEYRFPSMSFVHNNAQAQNWITSIFEEKRMPALFPQGTDFQLSVWAALQTIPEGKTATYAHIAELIDKPKAVRAVGTAIGSNPIAYLIPCHRIIRSDGSLGGFRWGLDCKKKILEWEKHLPQNKI